jgi:hypothetical protein
MPDPRRQTPEASQEPVIEDGGGRVISAKEVAAASSDILGKARTPQKPGAATLGTPPPDPGRRSRHSGGHAEADSGDELRILPSPPLRLRPIRSNHRQHRRRRRAAQEKPLTVAATPLISGYQLPPMDFSGIPTRPSSRACRGGFDGQRAADATDARAVSIDVALGDIAKGPTSRYELYPAPGVRLEKIINLNNNLAAALEAERISASGTRSRQGSVGVGAELIKTKVISATSSNPGMAEDQGAHPLALGKDGMGIHHR